MNLDLVATGTAAAVVAAATLRAATPILFASLGGLISELAGCINVALEGVMLVAAFAGVITSAYSTLWFPDAPLWLHPWLGCAAGLLAGTALAGLLAVFHLELGADLIVAGIGLNILAQGLTVLLMAHLTGDKGSTASLASFALPSLRWPGIGAVPVLGVLLNGDEDTGHNVLVYVAMAATGLIAWALRHTVFGLRLRATGENAEAALAAGLPVRRLRYAGLLLSGLLASGGGVFLGMGYLTLFQADMAAGRGYLALAAVFLGGRRPLGTVVAALVFGAASVTAARLGQLAVPAEVVFMIPPLVTIAALVLVKQHQRLATRRRAAAGRAALLSP
ncbi:ABC transporter permease [Nitrospirillum iridis]|uniref:Simple sugar transport system permease protein n=1 Tax=Nitrospirillum iridis TaxID=765888 RepID=A0A7X0EHY6_9PROT|nr:ABC transporter permease [Nitrospirillum iridis]MBB6255179.1 simple sugar transport system permease protein [Nitrospirillum iridis]